MTPNEAPGGRAIRRWVQEQVGRSYQGLADALGVTPQAIYAWRKGDACPEPDNRALLHALTGIEPTVWAPPAHKRARARKVARKLAKIRAQGEVSVTVGATPSTRCARSAAGARAVSGASR